MKNRGRVVFHGGRWVLRCADCGRTVARIPVGEITTIIPSWLGVTTEKVVSMLNGCTLLVACSCLDLSPTRTPHGDPHEG